VFAASPAQVIPYVVGAGGTSGATPADGQDTVFGPGPSGTLQITANGGSSAAENSVTGGAGGSGSPNSVAYPGGAGRTATGSVGGGGGGSGGSAAPGNTPVGTGATVLTGSGTWLCPAGVTSVLAECWGGGGGGGAGGSSTDGGGGGGGEYAAQTVAVTPGNTYAYACGAGGAGGASTGNLPGSAGASSTFTGNGSVTVTGHGGAGGPATIFGSAASGGSGSGNSTHHSGGSGGKAYPYTGGGGSSAGPSAPGNTGGQPGGAVAPTGGGNGGAGSGAANGTGAAGTVPGGAGGGSYNTGYAGGAGAAGSIRLTYPGSLGAPTSTGATAVTGGGAGGNGGGSANTAGSAGSAPGGGGGGADSAGTSEAGGAGAAGQIKITPYASPAFKTLVVHRPAPGCPAMFTPLVSVGGGSDTPNGGTEYTMPQPVSGVNARFGGTYTVVLINKTWNGSTARTITVTVKQYEYSGGASYSVSTAGVTVTPAQVTNGILIAGVLTLPVKAIAPDNSAGYFTVTVTDTNTSDRFYDVLLLDTGGQSVIINEPSSGYISYYLDEPSAVTDLGRILGSQTGRASAISVMDACQAISGGPVTVEPNENLLFAYSADGSAPAIGVSYYPRFYLDRV
jgi:hypothetical protein